MRRFGIDAQSRVRGIADCNVTDTTPEVHIFPNLNKNMPTMLQIRFVLLGTDQIISKKKKFVQ